MSMFNLNIMVLQRNTKIEHFIQINGYITLFCFSFFYFSILIIILLLIYIFTINKIPYAICFFLNWSLKITDVTECDFLNIYYRNFIYFHVEF